jgi:hypothetical protein
MLNATIRMVRRARQNVAKGLSPQGDELSPSELVSLLWEYSLEQAEAWVAGHQGTRVLAETLAQARAKAVTLD